jgi:myo-inositol-1(or 4)-monophosphatase
VSAIPPPEDLLELAVDVARQAGALLIDRRPPGELEFGTKSTPTDVVTIMDTAAEQLIVDALVSERPDDAVLGEEGVATTRSGGSGVRWVIDPIDGTVNYLYRLSPWAVSIAAEVDGTVVAGVVHSPALRETFTAWRGGGAFLDGERLRVSASPPPPAHALVATGFGYESTRRASQARILAALLPRVRDVRRLGAASLDLCYVGAGRYDAYYERGLNPWDLAAGGLVAAEAGAIVGGLGGRPAGADLVIAAPPGLYEQLHDLLAPLAPDRD